MTSDSLIKNIVIRRKLLGLSQAEFASRAGIAFRTYQRIEAEEISPRLETLEEILKVLDIPLSKFLVDSLFHLRSDQSLREQISLVAGKGWINPVSQQAMVLDQEVEEIKRSLEADLLKGRASMGYWEWNISAKTYYWSKQTYKVYDLDPNQEFSHDNFKNKIFTLDWKKIDEDILALVERNIPYENIHRVNGPNGRQFLVRALGRKFLSKNDELIIFGVAERLD